MFFLKKYTGLLIRFDDISPYLNWDLMDKCEKLFLKYNIKPVLGVIPNNQDKELLSFKHNKNFWNKVREWQTYGWEIAIHGYNHKYTSDTFKKDFFYYGGKSEFYGYPLDIQVSKIQKSIEIFKKNKIKTQCFFAPNHTYDLNTFKALRNLGINQVIDGYGLFPYEQNGIQFIPQLFHKIMILPFGIQSTQIHINTWTENDLKNFENFIDKNHEKIITYDYALTRKNNSIFCTVLRWLIEYLLKLLRFLNFK